MRVGPHRNRPWKGRVSCETKRIRSNRFLVISGKAGQPSCRLACPRSRDGTSRWRDYASCGAGHPALDGSPGSETTFRKPEKDGETPGFRHPGVSPSLPEAIRLHPSATFPTRPGICRLRVFRLRFRVPQPKHPEMQALDTSCGLDSPCRAFIPHGNPVCHRCFSPRP